MLRAQLLLLPSVQFAGYKVPHPLEARVVLKVQTDGELTPIQAVQTAAQQLILILSKMKEQFNTELFKVKALGTGQDDGGYGGMDGLEGSQYYTGGL
ncbi:hypothetical protein BCR35DRAFT_298480 [Leucosporidium creatinivorum]|uniref:DNA-directed RNA polymerase RBP11-like dimerisation domain-containing protein n=1 Tax=Leucosporidium creatinivorum TaxID=106004 RepID=A0A1Y2G8L0_9BASI|nr:hypothetical protein BCR35DRAFT_298480 [Leucosporidium creatinivorum]